MNKYVNTGIAVVWFFGCIVASAFAMEYFLTLYPKTFGALLPLSLIVTVAVIVGGRVLLGKVLK